MNSFLVICIALVVSVSAKPAELYTTRYDNINLDEILANKRLLEPYIKCVLDQGKCSPDGKELKCIKKACNIHKWPLPPMSNCTQLRIGFQRRHFAHIKEALENYCAKCTEPQRGGVRKVIGHLINNETAYWNQLSAKYDANKKYAKKYESELKTAKA